MAGKVRTSTVNHMINYWPRLTKLKVRPVLILHLAEKDDKKKRSHIMHTEHIRIKIYV